MPVNISGKDYTPQELEVLAKAGVLALKNDPASTTLPGAQLHGPLQDGSGNFGPLSLPGIRPEMLSAMQRPDSLSAALPLIRSDVWEEKIDIMTGVTASPGTNADGWCGDPPSVGALKKCGQKYRFGQYYTKDDLVALADVGMRRDRADVPRSILNLGPGAAINRFVPDIVFSLPDTMSQFRYNQWMVGVSTERDVCPVTIHGDDTTTGANREHGWIREFDGLDLQIKTGYTDWDSGLACPAADSVVMSYNALVSGSAADGRTITQYWQDLMWALTQRARKARLMGVSWVAVMRDSLFYELSSQIACNVYTARCTASTNAAQNQDAVTIESLRLSMLNEHYLLWHGQRIPVITDECITEEVLGDKYYKSDLYVAPTDWMGMPLTYFQYFPMDNAYAVEHGQMLGSQVKRLNGGLWLVGERDTGLCLEHHYQMQVRLIVEAPFLAGRIDDIWYYYYPETRDAIPGYSRYADGGVSYDAA